MSSRMINGLLLWVGTVSGPPLCEVPEVNLKTSTKPPEDAPQPPTASPQQLSRMERLRRVLKPENERLIQQEPDSGGEARRL